jgi:hypothetical protein
MVHYTYLTWADSMAWHEMRLILAMTLYNFDLELCEETGDWLDQQAFVVWHKKPLMCRLKPVLHSLDPIEPYRTASDGLHLGNGNHAHPPEYDH